MASVPHAQALGIASDAISAATKAVSVGFDIARCATDVGFGIAKESLNLAASSIETAAGPNQVSTSLEGVGCVVNAAHSATTLGQGLARSLTETTLASTQTRLRAAGAEEGALWRLTLGSETGNAVLVVDRLARRLACPTAEIPPHRLLSAATAWGQAQNAARETAREMEVESVIEPARLPDNVIRWIRFSAATFGHAWFAGLLDGWSVVGVARAQRAAFNGGNPGEAALECAGIDGRVDVLVFEQGKRDMYSPGYLVAVDHKTGKVVIAVRGTSCLADALSDMTCEPQAIELGGHMGFAHGGMLEAARRLDDKLAELTTTGLEILASSGTLRPGIMLTGHSLGAGVASLVAALWRDKAMFPSVPLDCCAFGCPQVLDEELALAQSNLTTSFICGDDLVPRFSLATAEDLRNAIVILAGAPQDGMPTGSDLMSAAESGNADLLAEAYWKIRQSAFTSSGRLFPAGRLVHVSPGGRVMGMSHDDVNELVVSNDMVHAHMPRRYLLALQTAIHRNAANRR